MIWVHYLRKKDVEWDYLDDAVFHFESGYIDAVQEIIKVYGEFNLVFVQSPYSQSLMKLLHLVSVHNTVIDFHVWSDLFENDSLVKSKLIRPLYYENEEMLQHKLFSVTFVKQYGDRVSPIKVMVNPSFKGEYHYQGNKALVLEGILEWSYTITYMDTKSC